MSDMLYLDSLPSMTGAHLVAGVPEHEESDEDESREKHGYNRQALFVGHIVTDLSDFSGESSFRAVPHLII